MKEKKKTQKEIIEGYKEIFEKYGRPLTEENINKIPIDDSKNIQPDCTIDIFVLTTDGIIRIFFKGKNLIENVLIILVL